MFNIMNLIPNSQNMEPVEPPCLDNNVVSFGKHKGKTFSDVYKNERGYVKWVVTKVEDCSGPMSLLKHYFTNRENSKKKSKASP